MSEQPWMPFYIQDFQIDTLELDVDEVGVYVTMLMLCWRRNGPLPGDDATLKKILQKCISKFHGHTYNRIVPKLLDRYFYRDAEGNWRQKRIEKELQKANKMRANASQNARKRWAKDPQNSEQPLKSNDIADAEAMHRARVPQPQSQSQNREIANPTDRGVVDSQPAPRKASRAKPRTQIAEDAQPTDKDRAAADGAGLSAEQFRSEWRRFRDHHLGKGSLMADWSAAWRTWIGNIAEFQRSQPRGSPSSGGTWFDTAELFTPRKKDGTSENPSKIIHLLPVAEQRRPGSAGDDDGGVSGNPVEFLGDGFGYGG